MRASRALLACILVLHRSPRCQSASDGDDASPSPPVALPASRRHGRVAADAALELVDLREQALLDGDKEAFLATISPDAEDFAATQARWSDNVAQPPATDFALELGDEDVMSRVSGDGDLQLPIDFTMRLDGFDAEPVTQPLIYTFVGDQDEVLLASDRNIQSDAFTGWVPAPWDVAAIVVEQSDAVLAVFDEKTKGDAEEVVDSIANALETVDALLPDWSGRAVAYTISDVDAIDQMSALDIDNTAGVAFPVAKRPGRRTVASYRAILNPHSDPRPVRAPLPLAPRARPRRAQRARRPQPAVAGRRIRPVRRRVERSARRPQAEAGTAGRAIPRARSSGTAGTSTRCVPWPATPSPASSATTSPPRVAPTPSGTSWRRSGPRGALTRTASSSASWGSTPSS